MVFTSLKIFTVFVFLYSRLLGDPVYESLARRAVESLWKIRGNSTGLLGDQMNIHTGKWVSNMSGLGAGMDSFYEYLLKSYIMFGEKDDLKKFTQLYLDIKEHLRHGRKQVFIKNKTLNNGTSSMVYQKNQPVMDRNVTPINDFAFFFYSAMKVMDLIHYISMLISIMEMYLTTG